MIAHGDADVLDFGGLRFGYGSDTTRTMCAGEPTAKFVRSMRWCGWHNRPASTRCVRV